MQLRPHYPFHGLIQIAGIHDLQEAQLCLAAGIHALGFPLRLPVHSEDISEIEAATVADQIRPQATPVLITYLSRATDIARLCRKVRMNHVQLHGDIPRTELAALRNETAFFIIKSLVIRPDGSNLKMLHNTVNELGPLVDAFITDTHDPDTGADGATGKTHDWNVSRQLVDLSPVPLILAGGLTAENVYDAIRTVRPAGVDAHTGVEGPDGRKDPALLQRFVLQAQQGFGANNHEPTR